MSAENENDSFDSKTSTFMSWLQQRPGINISPKIQIADLRDYGAGRGIGNAPSTISSDLS